MRNEAYVMKDVKRVCSLKEGDIFEDLKRKYYTDTQMSWWEILFKVKASFLLKK